MASISKPSLFWCIALFLMLATNSVHSQIVTSFTFSNSDANGGVFTYQGDANVPYSDANFVRLTRTTSNEGTTRNSVGRVLYTQPVQFWSNSTSRQSMFETTLQFVVTPNVLGAADGLTFFIAPVNSTVGAAGTNLGVFNGSGVGPNIFAVEFDCYSWGSSDPDYLHLGIDIEALKSVNTTEFNSGSGELVTATISYNSITKLIKVDATTASQTASLTYTYDLTTVLFEQVQVGISASTGGSPNIGIYGVFDLVSWTFTSTLVPVNATTTVTATAAAPTYGPKYLAV